MLQSRQPKRQSKAIEQPIRLTTQSHWRQIKTSSTVIPRRCCHASSLYKNTLYIYGGYDNNSPTVFSDMHAYSFNDSSWNRIEQKGELPGQRHSQSAVIYKDTIIMFGGMNNVIDNTNEIHQFNLANATWKKLKTTNTSLPIDSHKACLYQDKMIVGLGYSQNQYNSKIFEFDCQKLSWKCIFNDKNYKNNEYPSPRAHGSFNLHNKAIYIYGGKDFSNIFDDFWKFDLGSCKFSKIGLLTTLQGRFGHSGVILQQKLFIFGGTKGVTHEKNDLISIDLNNGILQTYWIDSQEQRLKQKQPQQLSPFTKKSRRDSAKKFGIEFHQGQCDQIDRVHQSPAKYRNKLREVNFYNHLYDNRKRQGENIKKTKRNPLLTQLDTHEGQSLNLTSTFDILTNSIMLTANKSQCKDQKGQLYVQSFRKAPKARDNYSMDIDFQQKRMIIFGGGMHKISYNDIIVIELLGVLNV